MQLRVEANQHILQLYHRQDLIAINTEFNDRLVKRVIELSAAECPKADGFSWAWLALGSEGRGEMSLKTDQDNALIYELSQPPPADFEQQLADWTKLINTRLDQAGLTWCSGDMMACNPIWRQSERDWLERFRQWINKAGNQEIMLVASACDMRAVYGDQILAETLQASFRTTAAFLADYGACSSDDSTAIKPFSQTHYGSKSRNG